MPEEEDIPDNHAGSRGIWHTRLHVRVTTQHARQSPERPIDFAMTSQSRKPTGSFFHPPLEGQWPGSKAVEPARESLQPSQTLCWVSQPYHSTGPTTCSPQHPPTAVHGFSCGTREQDSHSLMQEYSLQPHSPPL